MEVQCRFSNRSLTHRSTDRMADNFSKGEKKQSASPLPVRPSSIDVKRTKMVFGFGGSGAGAAAGPSHTTPQLEAAEAEVGIQEVDNRSLASLREM